MVMSGPQKRSLLASLSANRRGLTTVEYAVIAVAVAITGAVATKSLGSTVKEKSDQSGGDL